MSTVVVFERVPARPAAGLFAAVAAGALLLAFGMRRADFIHHDTSEVVMWAHSGWTAGFWKHPPLLPWITEAWTMFVPMSLASLSLLTAVNMTVCAWAVWRIAAMSRHAEDTRIGMLAILLLICVPFASVMAVKLNHNAILISIWPLTALAFLRALDQPTALRGLIFGIAAAAAVLAKYYSGLLLLGCVAASFADPLRAARFYRGPAPYVAVAVFAVAMAPHVAWLLEHNASSLSYAFGSAAADIKDARRHGLAMAISFGIKTPLVLAPMVIAALLAWRFGGGTRTLGWSHRFEREILLLAAVPYVLTIVMTAVFNLRGAFAWAMPVFVCLPAVVAARLGPMPEETLRRGAVMAFAAVGLAIVTAQLGMRQAVAAGTDGISEPRLAIAEATTRIWRQTTGRPLRLVAGDQRLASATVLLSADHPQAWPNYSRFHAPWVDPAVAAASGFVALCRPGDALCIAAAERASPGRISICRIKRRVEHLGAQGPWFEVLVLLATPRDQPASRPERACQDSVASGY